MISTVYMQVNLYHMQLDTILQAYIRTIHGIHNGSAFGSSYCKFYTGNVMQFILTLFS